MKMFTKIAQAYQEWRRKRRWNAKLQLEYLRLQVMEDQRWMAHDPKVSTLCQRYLDMLADDWERRSVRNVSDFRREIGCDPHVRAARERRNAFDELAERYRQTEYSPAMPADARAGVESLALYQSIKIPIASAKART